MLSDHTFHIPVLGIGYSVDAPVKVAHYGISSVVSLTDHWLIEKMRKYYCEKEKEPYTEITGHDKISNKITEYLNLIERIVAKNFENLKNSPFEPGSEIVKYIELLPDTSVLKKSYLDIQKITDPKIKKQQEDWLRTQLKPGSIDVNVMTKLDSPNFNPDGSQMSQEYNNAHVALRGYGESNLSSSIVFSAGMNPRLYTYLEQFKDFYPDTNGVIKKHIILKVSDYRSALVQGKILAKKGLWISEFRIESGLNCGGHAFATDGYLLGPILEEFKKNKEALYKELQDIYTNALKEKNIVLTETPSTKYTVQGGVGTTEEHQFLLRYYEMDSVGWGSPFLLVPEVMNVDEETLELLCNGKEEDYYMSDASPLGVKFNNFYPISMDTENRKHTKSDNPGFSCLKGVLAFDTTYSEKPICTASKQYMRLKIQDMEKQGLDAAQMEIEKEKMFKKSCLCVGLSTTTHKFFNFPLERSFVTICPGPNLAYFNRRATLREMVDHIYGRISLIDISTRPNMFVKELSLYVDHLKERFEENKSSLTEKNRQYLSNFRNKLLEGIEYYRGIMPELKEESDKVKERMLVALKNFETVLNGYSLSKV